MRKRGGGEMRGWVEAMVGECVGGVKRGWVLLGWRGSPAVDRVQAWEITRRGQRGWKQVVACPRCA